MSFEELRTTSLRPCIRQALRGSPWHSVALCGTPWLSMALHGTLWHSCHKRRNKRRRGPCWFSCLHHGQPRPRPNNLSGDKARRSSLGCAPPAAGRPVGRSRRLAISHTLQRPAAGIVFGVVTVGVTRPSLRRERHHSHWRIRGEGAFRAMFLPIAIKWTICPPPPTNDSINLKNIHKIKKYISKLSSFNKKWPKSVERVENGDRLGPFRQNFSSPPQKKKTVRWIRQ